MEPLPNPFDFRGQIALVTGATSPLGSGIARAFARAGAAVAVHYHSDAPAARRIVDQIQAAGGRAQAIRADLTQAAEVQALIDQVAAGLGLLDVLVNNAGIYPVTALLDLSPEEWDQMFAANLRSAFLCTQIAARAMIAGQRGGAIVNIATIEALQPAPGHSAYDSAKAGLVMFTRAAARELAPHGIRVNAVSPGLIAREGLEESWPQGVRSWLESAAIPRLGTPEDVANACLFLASPAASWITGTNLVVDGGASARPLF
jgi:NAD(P)-dependent dehydrogenase (short-subunit alcohol dehydrogenase family)